MFLIISSIFAGGIQAGDWTDYVECTPLQGGTYATCNADCNEDNPDCYYGNGIASSDQHCYCYTNMGPALSGLRRALITKDIDAIECTPLEGGTYAGCNTYCNFLQNVMQIVIKVILIVIMVMVRHHLVKLVIVILIKIYQPLNQP
eukprot:189693_1